jgi:hypothetical protein
MVTAVTAFHAVTAFCHHTKLMNAALLRLLAPSLA